MCFILVFVCETLDMSLRRVPLGQLKDDLGDDKTLANVVTILQWQVEKGSSRGTLSEKHQRVEQFNKFETPGPQKKR